MYVWSRGIVSKKRMPVVIQILCVDLRFMGIMICKLWLCGAILCRHGDIVVLFHADFTVTYLKMSPTAPFTFTLCSICVLLSIVSVARATDININVDKRILPIPNSITLKCTGFGDDMVDAGFKIKREVDGQVTDFTDYTSVIEYDIINQPLWVASFTLTPDREGRYTCQVGQVTSSNSVVLVGESAW